MSSPQPRRRRWPLGVAAVLTLGVVAAMALGARGDDPRSVEATSTFQSLTPTTFVDTVPAPGTLRAWERRDVRALTAGTVTWTAELGQRVEAGDTVARLDPLPLERAEHDATLAVERAQRQAAAARRDRDEAERAQRSALTQAQTRLGDAERALGERRDHEALVARLVALGSETEANLRSARDELDAAERERRDAAAALADASVNADARRARAAQDVVDAEATLAQALVTQQRARDDLAAATLRAPIAGVIDAVDVAVGGIVAASGAVIGVASDDRLALVAQIDETEIIRVTPGLEATVTPTAMPDAHVDARVIAVAPTARVVQNIPVFDVTLEVANPTLALRPGMTAEASIVLREVDGAVTVPARSVAFHGDGAARRARITVRAPVAGTSTIDVDVLATIGPSLIVHGPIPAGAEVEVPPAASGPTSSLPFGMGGIRVPGVPR